MNVLCNYISEFLNIYFGMDVNSILFNKHIFQHVNGKEAPNK